MRDVLTRGAALARGWYEARVRNEFPVENATQALQHCRDDGLLHRLCGVLGIPSPAGTKPAVGGVVLMEDIRGISAIGVCTGLVLMVTGVEGLIPLTLDRARFVWSIERIAACQL